MIETSLRVWTGTAGITAFAVTLPVIALYFLTSDPHRCGTCWHACC